MGFHFLENEKVAVTSFSTLTQVTKFMTDTFLCFVFAAIDYIHFLHKEKKKQEEEVSLLRKEVMALKIMKT